MGCMKRYSVNLTDEERAALDQILARERVSWEFHGRQCLDQRVGSLEQLRTLTAAWLRGRSGAPIRWRFTTKDARIKAPAALSVRPGMTSKRSDLRNSLPL